MIGLKGERRWVLKKSHLLNIVAGFIIIGILIFHIVNGADLLIPVCMIGLYVVSYVMERKGVDTLYWAILTIPLLFISLWTITPRLFFGP